MASLLKRNEKLIRALDYIDLFASNQGFFGHDAVLVLRNKLCLFEWKSKRDFVFKIFNILQKSGTHIKNILQRKDIINAGNIKLLV